MPDGERHAGQAGQRERRMHHPAQNPEQIEHVHHHRKDRQHAGQAVVDDHEQHDQNRADERGVEAAPDRIRAERRTDALCAFNPQRRLHRAGREDNREVAGLVAAHVAGGNHPGAVRNLALDDRGGLDD